MQPSGPTAAVLAPYWDFWEASVGSQFRSDREQLLSIAVEQLIDKGVKVLWHGLMDSPTAAIEAATVVAALEVDVVIIAQTMAAPPSHAMAALERLKEPLIVWGIQNSTSIPDEFDESHITSLGATVGTPMLTNVLQRTGRVYELLLSALGDISAVERVAGLARAGSTATRLSVSRMARIGEPIPGYACVDVADDLLRGALGIDVVRIHPKAVKERFHRVTDGDLERRTNDTNREFDVRSGPDEDLRRSLRLALALESIDDELNIDFGAMNCHVAEIRFDGDIGVTPCFGLGHETSRGIPYTCSGDVLTAVAMFVGRSLSGAALYHEIEAVDFETGEVALANSGEHDLGWCGAGTRPAVEPNAWFSSDLHTGVSVRFELPAGHATLIGFTEHPDEASGFRFVVAEGEISGRALRSSPTVSGLFRFESGPVDSTWERWANAGVNHHSAVSPGHLAGQIKAVANYLQVGCITV